MNDMVPLCCFKALLVAKLHSKTACALTKMKQAAFPTLDDINKALDQQVSETSSLWFPPSLVFSNSALQPSRMMLYTQGNSVHACS